jgi:hypothetical protein
MVANPFVTATNTLNALLPPAQLVNSGPLLTLFKFGPSGYTVATLDDLAVQWVVNGVDVGDTLTIDFGDGVFLLNPPPNQPFTLTWVGEVAQSNPPGTPVTNPLTAGYAIKSSKIPQSGKVTTDLGYPPLALDTLFKFNTGTQMYDVYTFDDLGNEWVRNGLSDEPTLGIAESAFFLRSAGGSWDRTFSVN